MLNNIRIVLVEPAGPLNVGAIARVMKNMGLGCLVLVAPKCDPVGIEARRMAVHAADVLESAHVVSTLPEALHGCQWAIATTARPRTLEIVLEHPRVILPWVLKVAEQGKAALIFGPEDRGLNNTELNYAQRFLSIPTNPVYPSLNLAQAVAICCYELYQEAEGRGQKREAGENTQVGKAEAREQGTEGSSTEGSGTEGSGTEGRGQGVDATIPTAKSTLQNSTVALSPQPSALIQSPKSQTSPSPAALDALEGYYQHLEAVLLNIGYLYPHTATSRMRKFRRLFSRAAPSEEEVALLRGILSQIEWAIQHQDSGRQGIKELDD